MRDFCELLFRIKGFCRLKKVQGKKKRDTAARDAIQASEKQDSGDAEEAVKTLIPSITEDEAAVDLLANKDTDVIF